MVDQSHNLKGKIEAMIQTVSTAQELYAKAALVDHARLTELQQKCELVDAEEWLRGALHPFARAAILDAPFVERFGLERARLETALAEHRSRRRDRGFLLWKLLQLALWSRQHLS